MYPIVTNALSARQLPDGIAREDRILTPSGRTRRGKYFHYLIGTHFGSRMELRVSLNLNACCILGVVQVNPGSYSLASTGAHVFR